jgi:signal transduction histidine kinase
MAGNTLHVADVVAGRCLRHPALHSPAVRLDPATWTVPFDVTPARVVCCDGLLDIESVRKANEALAERVRLRTAELERLNDELTAAKETAEQANASKTRFLVAASHDLRQPLQALTAHTDILGMRSLQPEAADDIEQLRNAGRTMSSILDMLVDISKLESGEISRDIRVFRVNSLLDELRKQYTRQAETKNLSLRINECDRYIRSDYNLLRLILQNLLSNAIRYTHTGSIVVDCLVRDALLRIAVTDTGIGIREADQETIFEEFYQLDNPARDRDRGMGMGLAIVRRMAALLDHPLHLQSVPGKGSTFAIDVPIATGMDTSASTPASPANRRPDPPAGTILLRKPVIISDLEQGIRQLLDGELADR